MLVLTRRPKEKITIAGNITITVVALEGGKVKLGIDAPPEVRIDREEIHQAIRAAGLKTEAPAAQPVLVTPGGEPAAKPADRPRRRRL